ncbi:hypothetical protein LWI28_025591 [Acer negundo]|uniref:Retrotransposon Copia-like N-terminal domain-containing protein n=1 Tax=Acer negundo TaxID=4023 RepID=A0AAD5NIZ5_ACENE|nr:hypothetical protein LWI28_025591 [Acer negundo]
MKTNPYVIHHSDSPSTALVTPLLIGDNYGSWSRAVTKALRAKSMLGFVDRSLPKPKETNDIFNWERSLQASKSFSRPSGKRQRPFSEHCNKYGHTLATCYQIHGFLDKQVKKSEPHSSTSATFPSQLTLEQYNKLLALLSKEKFGGSSVHLAEIRILNTLVEDMVAD